MNKLWVQFSFTFAIVLLLTNIASFIFSFGMSWIIPDIAPNMYEVQEQYIDVARPFVEQAIVNGWGDAEILKNLQSKNHKEIVQLIKEVRSAGYTQGVDVTDRSFGRILDDFFKELWQLNSFRSTAFFVLIGLFAGTLMSRYLARPIEKLTESVRKMGEQQNKSAQHRKNDIDPPQKLYIKGSREIEDLAQAFDELTRQLVQKEKLRCAMLADVSHELRTPLSVLEGQLRGTLDGVFEMNEERIAVFYQHTHHLIRLVEDLNLLAQAESKSLPVYMDNVDLTKLLPEIIELFQLQADSQKIRLQLDMSNFLPTMHVDGQRLRQIMHNFIANSLRHTSENGTIRVYARTQINEQERSVILGVQDSGEGMTQEQLEQVFNRFYRTDKARTRHSGGSGLGLAIVKSLVELMNGSVQIYSAGLGKGTDVHIKFRA